MKKLQSYLRYSLAKHKDINRVSFGDNLWQKAIAPSITHASGVWFNTSRKAQSDLTSFQYGIAKAILKVNSMPSIVATCGELGWLPILESLNISRISYYSRLLSMSEDRLTKQIFNELMITPAIPSFNYVDNIKDMLIDKGVDYMYNNQDTLCIHTYKKLVWSKYNYDFTTTVRNMSSLKYFAVLKEGTAMSSYLHSQSIPFKGIQLKFKLRTGIAGLGEDLMRQHRGEGLCQKCGAFESLKHFIFQCTAYNSPRKIMMDTILVTDRDIFNLFISDYNFAIQCVLGDHGGLFNDCFIRFLISAWKLRND